MAAKTAEMKAKKQVENDDLTAERLAARDLIHVDPSTIPDAPHGTPYSGCMVEVVDGPHKGRVGIYRRNVTAEPGAQVPKTILIHTRDDDKEDLAVEFEHCRVTKPGRR